MNEENTLAELIEVLNKRIKNNDVIDSVVMLPIALSVFFLDCKLNQIKNDPLLVGHMECLELCLDHGISVLFSLILICPSSSSCAGKDILIKKKVKYIFFIFMMLIR